MEVELGSGWADAVSKILRMGKVNPESNKILSKAKKDTRDSDDDGNESSDDDEQNESTKSSANRRNPLSIRLKPDPQKDALLENQLKEAATRGVVHLFNAVKTVNPKSDKKRKKKKKKKKKKPVRGSRGRT